MHYMSKFVSTANQMITQTHLTCSKTVNDLISEKTSILGSVHFRSYQRGHSEHLLKTCNSWTVCLRGNLSTSLCVDVFVSVCCLHFCNACFRSKSLQRLTYFLLFSYFSFYKISFPCKNKDINFPMYCMLLGS